MHINYWQDLIKGLVRYSDEYTIQVMNGLNVRYSEDSIIQIRSIKLVPLIL